MTTLNQTNKTSTTIGWRDIVRFAFHYWRPNSVLGYLSAGLMVAAVSMDAITPIFTGEIIDAVLSGKEPSSSLNGVWLAFFGYTGFSIAQKVFRQCSIWFWNRFAVKNLQAIVIDGMQKVQRFSSDWHANTFAGGTVRKITRGMWSFDMFEDTILLGMLPAITIMIGSTVILSLKLPALGLISAVLIIGYCGISIWMSVKFLAPRFKESADSDTKVGATLSDIITSNSTVKSFGAEAREDARFIAVTDSWKIKAVQAWQSSLTADGVRSALRVLMTSSMVGATIWLWSKGQATPGDIVLVIATFSTLGGYLLDIGQHISHLQRSVSDMEDAVEFWLRKDDVVNAEDAKVLTIRAASRRDLITFEGVAFKYPNGERSIYENLNLKIATGEKIALVGASGSGKSTFIKLLQRLYNVTGGAVLIDGQDIAKVTLESLRKAIALVPQDPVLFHRTLSENISYGRIDATADEIVSAAKKAFAHDFIERLPKGYDTLVGERGIKLSGGERQRVAIARAILADAPILILDEATSSLDSISEHYIQQALEALMKGRTTITVAHRMSTIQTADRILVFDKGEIIEEGTHRQLMQRSDSQYRRLYEMQALGLGVEDDDSMLPSPAMGE